MGRISSRVGKDAEEQAACFLAQQGLRLVECNYRCDRGEIDLVMQDGEQTVFVEVRYRSDERHGTAAESVTRHKQQRILHTASHYLQRVMGTGDVPCRFDVVTITGHGERAITEWIQDAFQP